MSRSGFGVLAAGGYVPRARLPGRLVAEAHSWFEPSLAGAASANRSFCGWDEDALTMAVEAARSAAGDPADIDHLELASTTLPFADRSNAGVLREALGVTASATLTDSGGSLRAGTSALLRALGSAEGEHLVVASDCVDSKPGSASEAHFGHGAAAMRIGRGEPVAVLRGAASLHQDFVDHYREAGARFSYTLEARWTRDAGYRRQTADTFRAALADAGLGKEELSGLLVAAPPPLAKAIARGIELEDAAAALTRAAGYCSAAQPLLLLSHALEHATPGDIIALIGIGQGVDAMILEVTAAMPARPLTARLEAGVEESNYCRYLALRRLLEIEEGIRAERDNRTAQAAFWRKHEELTGFVGGRCSSCETLQFPSSKVCVKCGAEDSQSPERMADMNGRVRSFTEDWLAFTPNPPLVFGNVGFAGGANVMMEFTDVAPGELEVGMPVELMFRIKDFDRKRGFRRYFWKPTPAAAPREETSHG